MNKLQELRFALGQLVRGSDLIEIDTKKGVIFIDHYVAIRLNPIASTGFTLETFTDFVYKLVPTCMTLLATIVRDTSIGGKALIASRESECSYIIFHIGKIDLQEFDHQSLLDRLNQQH